MSSTQSSVSVERLPVTPSVKSLYLPKVDPSELYLYSLKLLVFEYINEPRFRRRNVPTSSPRASVDKRYNASSDRRASRLGAQPFIQSLGNDVNINVLRTLKRKLEVYLNNVTINKIAVSNQDYRRSLMKFYNDYFLNPNLRKIMEDTKRPEDLIVYFSKTASNQLSKFNLGNVQTELYNEISKFIDLLIQLISNDAPQEFIGRLRDFENTLKQGTPSLQNKRSSIYQNLEKSSTIIENPKISPAYTPTFRLEQITHSTYLSELFDVDPITLQQDVIKVSKDINIENYCKELHSLQDSIKNDEGILKVNDFSSVAKYTSWKNYQMNEINALFEKFESRSLDLGESSDTSIMIPKNPRDVFIALMIKIFEKECSNQLNSLNLSQDAMFFLTKYSKYWMIDYFSTLSVLLYTAMNLSVLNDEEINIQLTENLFSMLQLRIIVKEENMDTSAWNDRDQKQWIINILHTSKQCINTLDNLLSALYATTKPKFSPVLTFYYKYIESDPAVGMFKSFTQYSDKNDIKRLKKTIFKASELYYISLLESIPKDKSIKIHHIQDIGEKILQDIKEIQKRYTKHLLDKLNIASVCAETLIVAYATDFPSMVKRAEKYYKLNNEESIAPVNALELYSVIRQLENIYLQIQPKKDFPFDAEDMFYKYLTKITRDIIQNVKGVITTSLKNETWERVNSETSFSHSVLDIFKMVNESINLIKGLGWGNLYHTSKILTYILKAFSDDLKVYSQRTLKLIQRDLRQASLDALQKSSNESMSQLQTLGSDIKNKKRWTFHDMKNALRYSSTSSIVPPTFEYRARTCIMLNDLETMIKMVNELDEKIDPENISLQVEKGKATDTHQTDNQEPEHQLKQIYTIRVIEAKDIRGYSSDGMSNASVSLRCSAKQRETGSTRVISKTTNPVWDEEFEIDLPFNGQSTITFNVWHHTSSKLKSLSGDDLCGRATLIIDPKHFTDDGFPNARTLDLSTQGQLSVEISLETEKMDALFSFGRSYRILSRSRDQAIALLVGKFSSYVVYSFSRETLQKVRGSSGTELPTDDAIYDAIIPLFDYLNSNLNILASQLTGELLFMVMLKAWFTILKAANNLVLPQLSIAKNKLALTKKNLWGHNSLTITGYGRALTIKEVEIIFKWLDALCVDFFYNNGEGPPLQDLKNKDYQKLMLVPAFYDKSITELKLDVKRLTPSYYAHLDRNYRDNNPNLMVSRRLTSVERRKTIMNNNFRKTKEQIDREDRDDSKDMLERDSELLDIILRILIAKGEIDFVYKHLHERKLRRKMIVITSVAGKVSKGHKIKYKK